MGVGGGVETVAVGAVDFVSITVLAHDFLPPFGHQHLLIESVMVSREFSPLLTTLGNDKHRFQEMRTYFVRSEMDSGKSISLFA